MKANSDLNHAGNFLSPLETNYHASLGFCIYCGEKHDLEAEHIIPYWMAGAHVIRNGSCRACAKITGGFEGQLSDTTFLALRKRINLQSRSRKKSKNKKKEPPTFEITTMENGVEVKNAVSAGQLPPIFPILVFPPAGIIAGRPPLPALKPDSLPIRLKIANISHKTDGSQSINGTFKTAVNPTHLMRLAAKIAHGFMFINGLHKEFELLLTGSILTGHYVSYFVGCPLVDDSTLPLKFFDGPAPPENSLHYVKFLPQVIGLDDSYIYLIASVHLFCEFGGPVFEVVTARKKLDFHVVAGRTAKYIPDTYGKEGKFESCNIWINANFDKENVVTIGHARRELLSDQIYHKEVV